MTSPTLSVVVPCYNEEKNIPELIKRCCAIFQRKNLKAELILVNDGSTDDTARVSTPFLSSNVHLINHQSNQGMEAAWKTGIKSAKGHYICLIDADLQYQPEDIWRLFRELQTHHWDIVQGYRSSIGRLKDSRKFLSVSLNKLLNGLFGMTAKDNKSGFICCRKDICEHILTHRFHYHYFQTFITVSAKSKGYQVGEVETLFESRLLGESFIKGFPLKLILKALIDLFKAFIEYRFLSQENDILKTFLRENNLAKPFKPTIRGFRKLYFRIYIYLMPFHHWLISKKAKTYYEQLDQSQWLSPDQIKHLQEKKLRHLIHHAYHHVAYYREWMDAHHISPEMIQSIDDLQQLPLLSKEDVANHLYFDLFSDNHNKKHIQRITTSGSTGNPFVCFVDQTQLEMRWAATLRGLQMSGYRFGQKVMRLWHQTIGMSRKQIIKEWLDAKLSRRSFVPVFELTEKNIKKMIKKITQSKPVLIDGYAEAFHLISQTIDREQLKGSSVKSIVSSAQLLEDDSRQKIESSFDAHVYDKYGSREFSGIAYQCEKKDGYHIVAENFIVEVLKNGKPALPGETGEIVITDLNNFCMPFIRYRIGDLAVAADNTIQCSCGRGLPKLQSIQGRVQAIIQCKNGKHLLGSFFSHFFKEYYYCIKQFQIIQESVSTIRLNIVKADRFDKETFNLILKKLTHYIGADMTITPAFVDAIPLTKTGKYQSVLSKCNLDFQSITKQGSKK